MTPSQYVELAQRTAPADSKYINKTCGACDGFCSPCNEAPKWNENDGHYFEGQIADIPYRLIDQPYTLKLLHGLIGLATESGESLDAFKKFLFYGKELDVPNIIEELGDKLWYIAEVISALDGLGYKITLEEVMEKNIAKLKKRYPEGFSESDALNRNLEAEAAVFGV